MAHKGLTLEPLQSGPFFEGHCMHISMLSKNFESQIFIQNHKIPQFIQVFKVYCHFSRFPRLGGSPIRNAEITISNLKRVPSTVP